MQIIKLRKTWLVIFLLVIILGISAIFIFRIGLSADFTGGTLVEIKTRDEVNVPDLRLKLREFYDKKTLIIQESGEKQYLIRTNVLEEGEYKDFKSHLGKSFPRVDILRHESIGATVGKNLMQKAITAIILAAILIVIYIAYAFRRVPRSVSVSPWAFGTIAIITLVHDLIASFAVFSIVGSSAGFEINSMIIVAALTILGFSVNDTIVVFDRMRENLIQNPQKALAENANASVNQTFARSLNTSLTTILILITMLILGGTTIKPFVLLLAIGIGIGTYSSIFVASPLLVMWSEHSSKARD